MYRAKTVAFIEKKNLPILQFRFEEVEVWKDLFLHFLLLLFPIFLS